MILADTSVWIDHLRREDVSMVALLDRAHVLIHPFVIGEVALGSFPHRELVLANLASLPRVTVATDSEVLGFIDRYKLFGVGIGYVDAHLLAAAQLDDAFLWTRDKRLVAIADQLASSDRNRSRH